MSSPTTWSLAGALLAALSIAPGCGRAVDPYPAPQPADTSGGGTGGATSTTGGGGASGPSNLCECAHELAYDDGCGSCVNDANNPSTGACKAQYAQCEADGGCKDILTCPGSCAIAMVPANQRAACISACFVPFANDPSHDLAAAYFACACGQCAQSCGQSPEIACQ
jgi:hypothetical protein